MSLYISKLHNYTPCIMTLPLHNHSFVVSVRTLHVLKRTRNEHCTVPAPCGELCTSMLGLPPYLSEMSYRDCWYDVRNNKLIPNTTTVIGVYIGVLRWSWYIEA